MHMCKMLLINQQQQSLQTVSTAGESVTWPEVTNLQPCYCFPRPINKTQVNKTGYQGEHHLHIWMDHAGEIAKLMQAPVASMPIAS